MGKEQLYQYAVIKHPTDEERKQGQRSKIVVEPSSFCLARNQTEVMMKATREIPQEDMKDADRLEVAIRPF